MKKQLLIFAAITAFVFTSCSKEKIETLQANNSEEIATARSQGGNGITPVSNKGLLGRFEFNGNLKDATGQLQSAYSTVSRVIFTSDRKGQSNSAIRFNAAYGVDITDVPSTPDNASFSVWIQTDTIPPSGWLSILSTWKGFNLQQMQQIFYCNFWNNIDNQQNVSAYPIDKKWHHIAATRDNTSMKLYVDGILIGTSPTPTGASNYVSHDDYLLGYGGGQYWKGSVDDLRFYSRTLSPAEISTLANQ
jgi:hypothetical protein